MSQAHGVSTRTDQQTDRVTYAHTTWDDWGTSIHLGVADAARLASARSLTVDLMSQIGSAISRFDHGSDLVRANRAAGETVTVSPWLVAATESAIAAAVETDGLVDPTLGHHLIANGYDDDLAIVQSRDPDARVGAEATIAQFAGRSPTEVPQLPALSAQWRAIELTDTTVRVPPATALDLGAIGKAFAADRISRMISEHCDVDCILSLGGDVAVANRPGAQHRWRISIAEAPGESVAEVVALPSGGAATSTTIHRRWHHHGRPMHHLIDPSTGLPAHQRWRTATVIAADCVSANTASTAALVLGDRAQGWLTERGLAARLVDQQGAVIFVGHWPSLPHPDATPAGGDHR